jgi:hypothetical protein
VLNVLKVSMDESGEEQADLWLAVDGGGEALGAEGRGSSKPAAPHGNLLARTLSSGAPIRAGRHPRVSPAAGFEGSANPLPRSHSMSEPQEPPTSTLTSGMPSTPAERHYAGEVSTI